MGRAEGREEGVEAVAAMAAMAMAALATVVQDRAAAAMVSPAVEAAGKVVAMAVVA